MTKVDGRKRYKLVNMARGLASSVLLLVKIQSSVNLCTAVAAKDKRTDKRYPLFEVSED